MNRSGGYRTGDCEQDWWILNRTGDCEQDWWTLNRTGDCDVLSDGKQISEGRNWSEEAKLRQQALEVQNDEQFRCCDLTE